MKHTYFLLFFHICPFNFHDLYTKAHPNLKKETCHDEVNMKWNDMKQSNKLDEAMYQSEMQRLKNKLTVRKLTMFHYLSQKKAQRKG